MRMPAFRDRIDEMTEGAQRRGGNAQEEAGRKTRRRPGIGLRFAAPGECAVEHMRAETRFGRVAACPVAIAEQGIQPAIRVVAGVKIVDELCMADPARERRNIERLTMIARQGTEAMLRDACAFRI